MQGKRWWWWVALAGAIANTAAITVSFRHAAVVVFANSWAFSVNKGVVAGDSMRPLPNLPPPGRAWHWMFGRARKPFRHPWQLLPTVSFPGGGAWRFKLPLHVPLLALLAVLALPMLPPFVRRQRRKRGLCVKCAYDLTGNVSGICPECGTGIRS